jgi:hypothetical protein
LATVDTTELWLPLTASKAARSPEGNVTRFEMRQL